MILKERELLVSILLEETTQLSQRIEAARALAEDGKSDSMGALLRIACSDDENPVLQAAAGESLARRYARSSDIDQAPLESFSGPAYIGFDGVAAQLLSEGDASL
jgi:hypothetical protein